MSAFAELLILPLSLLAAPQFELPLACSPGVDCVIQNYVDHDTSTDRLDPGCGKLTYDGHQGTDFRLRSMADLARRVPVRAAAAGVVSGTRDGEPDISVRRHPVAKGKEAGNGVKLDHGDGWETQYSHLMNGSIQVMPGQSVKTGDILGYVGLSGNTEFPHVDFAVRQNGKSVDPFAPEGLQENCRPQGTPLWAPAVRNALAYQPATVLQLGVAERVLSLAEVDTGSYLQSDMPAGTRMLAAHVQLIGARPGDRESLVITDAYRNVVAKSETTISEYQAIRLSYVAGTPSGRKAWPTGVYFIAYALRRNGEIVIEEKRQITIGARP